MANAKQLAEHQQKRNFVCGEEVIAKGNLSGQEGNYVFYRLLKKGKVEDDLSEKVLTSSG